MHKDKKQLTVYFVCKENRCDANVMPVSVYSCFTCFVKGKYSDSGQCFKHKNHIKDDFVRGSGFHKSAVVLSARLHGQD